LTAAFLRTFQSLQRVYVNHRLLVALLVLLAGLVTATGLRHIERFENAPSFIDWVK